MEGRKASLKINRRKIMSRAKGDIFLTSGNQLKELEKLMRLLGKSDTEHNRD